MACFSTLHFYYYPTYLFQVITSIILFLLMLSVNSLPFAISEQILRYATISDYGHISTWTGHLHLLSICQQWRYVGDAMLYEHIFFRAVSNAPETNNTSPTRIHIDGLNQKVAASNIGLAGQISAARDYPELWPGIQSLEFLSYMCKDKLSYVDELLIGDSSTDAINERLILTARLVKLAMPNVYSYVIGRNTYSDFVKPMTDSLAVEYSPQLSYIHSTSAPSSYSDAHFTDCLTYLRLPLDKNAKNILPKIPAQQLEHLSLSDVNEDFSWKYFQPEGSSADLVFNYLKTLVLVFYHQINNAKPEEFAGEWRYQNSNKPLKVHFPKLDYVHLYQAPIDPDILFTDVFPSRLGMIDVCTASIDCRDYNKTSLSNIYYVRFRYLSSEESFSDDFYNETNFFYNQVEVNKYSSLIIENTHSLDISRVTWVNLKGLAFQVVDFDKLMPLLQKPENVTCLYLVKLNTSDFDFADDPATWSIPNSMLTDFAIKRHVKGNSVSDLFNALVFTLKAVPSITKLGISSKYKSGLIDAIEKGQVAEAYPYIRNIYISTKFTQDEQGRLLTS